MPSPNDSLPKKIWEITVQVENGDWHWTRTTSEVTFDEAVDQANWFKQNFSYGKLVAIIAIETPALKLRPGRLSHYHEDPMDAVG